MKGLEAQATLGQEEQLWEPIPAAFSSDPASWPCLGSLSLRGARVGGGQTPA